MLRISLPRSRPKGTCRGRIRSWIPGAVLLIGALAVFPIWIGLTKITAHPPCQFRGRPAAAARIRGIAAPAKPAKLALLSGQPTVINFGRAIAVRTLTLGYGVTGALRHAGVHQHPGLRVTWLEFQRSDQAALPDGRIKVAAWYEDGRVQLEVCINRATPAFADPGTYQGTVSIVDPRVARVDVPVQVNLSYPTWQWICALLVLASLAGSWYAWLLHRYGRGGDGDNLGNLSIAASIGDYLRWFFTPAGIVSVVVGVAAALTVYNATYLSNGSWGASGWQYLSILGVMFSGFVAGATTIHLGAKVASK